ncbi:TPA: hypothetical protein PXP53_004247 [Yersinia enterocolitica]|nr:hypothetical protein [Yersinia enterocolitica]
MNINKKELDKTLDTILISAFFNCLGEEKQKEVLRSVHCLIDNLPLSDSHNMTYDEQVLYVESLRKRLSERFPQALSYPREYLLDL